MPRQPIQIPVRYFRSQTIRKAYEVRAWKSLFLSGLCFMGGFILAQLPQTHNSSASSMRSGHIPTICSLTFQVEGEITDHATEQKVYSLPLAPIYTTNFSESSVLVPQEDVQQPSELPLCMNDIIPLQQSDDILADAVEESFFDTAESTTHLARSKRVETSKKIALKESPAPTVSKQSRTNTIAAKSTVADSHHIGVRYREASKPPYPVSLRMRRYEGSVHVRIFVNAQGYPTAVDILTGSGFEEMDTTAERWIMRHWKFYPETINGQAVASVVSTHIHFKLN